MSDRTPAWVLPLLVVLFFLSGACPLVYQVMWLRMLALVFGVTVYAASTVLASFIGGLALGSYAAGRIAARFASPLRAFGLIEIGVGVTAFDPRVARPGEDRLGGAVPLRSQRADDRADVLRP